MAWWMSRLTNRTTGASSVTSRQPVEVRAADVVAEVEVGAERRQLALGPVVLVDPVLDLGTPGEHEPDPAAGQPRDVVLELEVADRLHRHRDLEQVAVDGERDDGVTPGEVAGQEGRGGGVDLLLTEVDVAEPGRLGREPEQGAALDQTTLDECLDDGLVARHRRRRERHVVRRHRTGCEQRVDGVADGGQHARTSALRVRWDKS